MLAPRLGDMHLKHNTLSHLLWEVKWLCLFEVMFIWASSEVDDMSICLSNFKWDFFYVSHIHTWHCMLTNTQTTLPKANIIFAWILSWMCTIMQCKWIVIPRGPTSSRCGRVFFLVLIHFWRWPFVSKRRSKCIAKITQPDIVYIKGYPLEQSEVSLEP